MLRLSLIFCISLTFSDVFSASGDPEIEFRSSSKEISEISQQPWVQLFNPDTTRRRLLKLEMENQVPMEYLERNFNWAAFICLPIRGRGIGVYLQKLSRLLRFIPVLRLSLLAYQIRQLFFKFNGLPMGKNWHCCSKQRPKQSCST